MTSVAIRSASLEDLPGMLEIYNEAVHNTTATYDYEPRTLDYRVGWFEEHQKVRLPVYVAVEAQGRVVGWSALNQRPDSIGFRFSAEEAVYVAADQRGKGVGRLLLPPLIETARRRGLHAIFAAIDAENAASIHLHTSFGFERVGTFHQAGFRFGRWLDVVYMELLL